MSADALRPDDATDTDATTDTATPTGRWRRSWAAPALVFATSAAVLVIEILASRLVAPYVGVSLETYTGIIGTVLAGIALGSAAGGRAADRFDARRMLGPLLIASGVATLLCWPIIAALGPGVAAQDQGPGGIVVLAVAAFVVPTALLSAVSPMAAKLRLATTAETGTVVGGLSAAGTAGALFGTFATGFVFVATLPTRPVLVAVGLALAVTGVALTVAFAARDRRADGADGEGARRRPPIGGIAVTLVATALAALVESPCQRETTYYCLSVLHDPARPNGRLLVLDNLHHSYVDLREPTHLEFRYTRLFAQVVNSTLGGRPLNALHIGGGGFTMPRWLLATRPASTNTVLELDPGVLDTARDQLGLTTGPGLNVRTGDARRNLMDEPDGAYDLVIGDAFGGLSVPWHLTTSEFVADIKRTMRPGGVYVLNVIDAGPRDLVRAVAATLQRRFAHVALIGPPLTTSGNHVLVASDNPIRLGGVHPDQGAVMPAAELAEFIDGAVVLRDDYAPVDQLLTRL